MVLCGTKNGSYMALLEEIFEAPLFLRVYVHVFFSDYFTSADKTVYYYIASTILHNSKQIRQKVKFWFNTYMPVDEIIDYLFPVIIWFK